MKMKMFPFEGCTKSFFPEEDGDREWRSSGCWLPLREFFGDGSGFAILAPLPFLLLSFWPLLISLPGVVSVLSADLEASFLPLDENVRLVGVNGVGALFGVRSPLRMIVGVGKDSICSRAGCMSAIFEALGVIWHSGRMKWL